MCFPSGPPLASKTRRSVRTERTRYVVVPFPEAGEGWGDSPEVRLSTPQAARYEEAITGTPV